nr:MAG TPA: hypothetical protein [Caudoviricetes sp.]
MHEIAEFILNPMIPLALLIWGICIIGFAFAVGFCISFLRFILEEK